MAREIHENAPGSSLVMIPNAAHLANLEQPAAFTKAMRDFLAAHPGDSGGARYTWGATGLDAGEVREQVAVYQERFGVPTETLK